MGTFDLYGRLLKYPSDMRDFSAGLDELDMRDTAHLKACEPGLLQEEYVESFDFSEKSSLMITNHVSSDERERNSILAGLAAFTSLYGARSAHAAPDFLPDILCAFQTALEREENRDAVVFMSGMLLKVVQRIEENLKKSGSLYFPLMRGLRRELGMISEGMEVGNA